MPADPTRELVEAWAAREGLQLVPKSTDKRAEPTDMDRLSEALKKLTSAQLVRVIGKLKNYGESLQLWVNTIEDEYRRRAAEITIVTLPGVHGNGWDPPRIRGLVEEIGFADAAIRLAEAALSDRILREASAKVLNIQPGEDPASYLVIESLVELVMDVAGGEEDRHAVA